MNQKLQPQASRLVFFSYKKTERAILCSNGNVVSKRIYNLKNEKREALIIEFLLTYLGFIDTIRLFNC